MNINITSGRIQKKLKVVVYGPEGIGKTTFASRFPNPVFIDTEGSTEHMDVRRTDRPESWTGLLEQVRYFTKPDARAVCGTLVLDTADWAERMCAKEVCAKFQKNGIEDFGYGKGYTYVYEEFGKLLNLLQEVVNNDIHVVITAHAVMRKFEQPDEMGAYDRWELKLISSQKCSVANMVKEWADMVLFANYKTFSVAVDDKGTKHKAQGGKRVMYTAHHPCWDAKNRFGLPDELSFDYAQIAARIESVNISQPTESVQAPPVPAQPETRNSVTERQTPQNNLTGVPAPTPTPQATHTETHTEVSKTPAALPTQPERPPKPLPDIPVIPPAVRPLMEADRVSEDEIRKVVASKGYYPEDTPISVYSEDFVNGWIVPCWKQIVATIEADPKRLPF